MEEEKLKSIFASFAPELSPDTQFMSRLKRNLESVELVKRHAEQLHKSNRRAIAVAALAGFIFGIIAALSYPTLIQILQHLPSAEMGDTAAALLTTYGTTLTLGTLCLLGTLLTYTAYDLTRSIQKN